MPITAKLDEFGKPAWIALIILGFMAWWPLGLGVLAFTIGSGRMGCGGSWRPWPLAGQDGAHAAKMDWMRNRMGGGGPGTSAPSSGNRAFDEYRTETLRRLEEEQREFRDFLDRLRFAKDKTEFDQFMAERRDRPAPEVRTSRRAERLGMSTDRRRPPERAAFCVSRPSQSPAGNDSLTIISAV